MPTDFQLPLDQPAKAGPPARRARGAALADIMSCLPALVPALAIVLVVLWVGLSACGRAWWPPEAPLEQGRGELPWAGKDPRYPFLHMERTPDTLGPLFEVRPGAPPPNLVFIIVEGLGRTFSGPGARLGSFTPFLDELAGRGLYFENFLSGQGRSFGVLTTVFASMPFGDNGLAAPGDRMPRHASLLSVLKQQGYRLKFYSGSLPESDDEGRFLRQEGVDSVVRERNDGPPARRNGDRGHADAGLVEMALRREGQDARASGMRGAPSLAIIRTASMRDPFTFPDKPRYLEKVGQRLALLGIGAGAGANAGYAAQREIFASILYTDDALRRYFDGAARLPGYANTVFIVTGGHRLPELPMDTRIERFHVPLIVYSPLLKRPRAIKAVSSQFDIAPSLLAWLGNNYGLRSPSEVTWLGTGLDTAAAFRNLHAIPLKQDRTGLGDFVSGSMYLAQGRLYTLADGMLTASASDGKALSAARAQFQAFLLANGVAARAPALAPPANLERLAPYRAGSRSLGSVGLGPTPN
jgi:hypothetical protein